MESKTTLKPCPFCGCLASLCQRNGEFLAECDNPECSVNPCAAEDSEAAAVDVWNTRPQDAILEAAQRVADAQRRWMTCDLPEYEYVLAASEFRNSVNALAALLPAKGEKP